MKILIRYLTIICIAYVIILSVSIVKAQARQSEWTVSTLKEDFDRRFMNLEIQVSKIEGIELNLDSKIKNNSDEIEKIKNIKRGGEIVWAYIVAVLAFTISIANLIINIQKRNAK